MQLSFQNGKELRRGLRGVEGDEGGEGGREETREGEGKQRSASKVGARWVQGGCEVPHLADATRAATNSSLASMTVAAASSPEMAFCVCHVIDSVIASASPSAPASAPASGSDSAPDLPRRGLALRLPRPRPCRSSVGVPTHLW